MLDAVAGGEDPGTAGLQEVVDQDAPVGLAARPRGPGPVRPDARGEDDQPGRAMSPPLNRSPRTSASPRISSASRPRPDADSEPLDRGLEDGRARPGRAGAGAGRGRIRATSTRAPASQGPGDLQAQQPAAEHDGPGPDLFSLSRMARASSERPQGEDARPSGPGQRRDGGRGAVRPGGGRHRARACPPATGRRARSGTTRSTGDDRRGPRSGAAVPLLGKGEQAVERQAGRPELDQVRPRIVEIGLGAEDVDSRVRVRLAEGFGGERPGRSRSRR